MIRAAALVLMLGASPALACSPAFIEPSPFPVQGPGCAFSIDLNQTDSVNLGPTARLANGLILQALSEGNGCYSRNHLIVHDCAARAVMVIGAEHFSLMEAMGREAEELSGLEIIRETALAASTAGRPLAPEDFTTLSRAQGYGAPQMLRPTDSLRFDRQTVPLGCACRTAGG
jgi:hypothetical protein